MISSLREKWCVPWSILISNINRKCKNKIRVKNDISQAIQNINSGKKPGPHGLPIEFDQIFQNKWIIPLSNNYNKS